MCFMKRSEVISIIEDYLIDYKYYEYGSSEFIANQILNDLEKVIGMLPPNKKVVLTPDPHRPGKYQHGPTERGWDEEE